MAQFDPLIAEITRQIRAADREPLARLRQQLEGALPGPVAAQSMEALTYYIETCPSTLREFALAASASCSESLQQVAASLYQYLIEPNDLLDDTNGILGFLDDAWLIHNTAYRCIQSQLLGPEPFGADWNAIVMGDRLALHLFPPHVKAALDEIVGQYTVLVAREMQQFAGGATWGASAVTSANPVDSTAGKTIDDYYYTIGGTAYLSTKPVS